MKKASAHDIFVSLFFVEEVVGAGSAMKQLRAAVLLVEGHSSCSGAALDRVAFVADYDQDVLVLSRQLISLPRSTGYEDVHAHD